MSKDYRINKKDFEEVSTLDLNQAKSQKRKQKLAQKQRERERVLRGS